MEEEDVKRIVRKSLEPDNECNGDNDSDNEVNDTHEHNSELPHPINKCKKEQEEAMNEWNKLIDDALETIHNFVPKRKRKNPPPMFSDLSYENEKRLRVRNRGAPYYWHMPFRHRLFLASNRTDGETSSTDEDNDSPKEYQYVDTHNSRYS